MEEIGLTKINYPHGFLNKYCLKLTHKQLEESRKTLFVYKPMHKFTNLCRNLLK